MTIPFLIDLLIDYGIYLIPSLGIYILISCGQVSFGHGAIVGITAYASAIFVVKIGVPFHVAILLCGVVGALTGFVFGTFLGLRLRGIYQGIATFAVGEALVTLWLNIDYIGGASGFGLVPMKTGLLEILILVAASLLCVHQLERSRFGLSFRSIRDNEVAASTRGIDVRRMKLLAWVSGCALTGIGGSLFAHRVGLVSPPEFGFYLSLNILIAPVIGGIQTYLGTIVGAAIVYFLPWILHLTEPGDRLILNGALLVAMMIFRPQGIVARKKDPVIPKFGIGGAR